MTEPDLVSIILTAQIPTWFNTALESALAQNYPHCEIIIADSGGDRYIPDLLTPYLNQPGHKIRHLVFDKNDKGIFESAIRQAYGKYIKFVSDAEILEPYCVETLVSGLVSQQQCRIAASKRKRVDPKGGLLPDLVSTCALVDSKSIIKGRDLLCTQSRVSYSLLGELTASLFYRDDVMGLMSDDRLFVINNEPVIGVEGLLLYSKLLAKTDLIWFPEALCAVRASEVYKQPHQRDSEEAIKKARDVVLNAIRSEVWYNESNVNEVRVAPFENPNDFTRKNLVSHQYHYLNLNRLEWWNRVRKLESFQEIRLQQMAVENPEITRVGVIINVAEDNASRVDQTLASLSHQNISNLQLIPILVGAVENTPFEIVRYSALTDNRIDIINRLITERDEQWYIFVDAGSYFMPSGLVALSTTLPQVDNLLAIYADEYFYMGNDPSGVIFRPDLNLDLVLSSPKTMAQHWLFRRELLLAAEGLDKEYPASAEFDLIVKMLESQGLNCAGHLVEPLITSRLKSRAIVEDAAIIERHLHNRGYPKAQIALDSYYNYRLRYQHAVKPKVSIVILANWHLPSLITSVTTILEKTSYLNYELLIVADGQRSEERENWLKTLASVDPKRIRILNYQHTFNHGGMVNLAALNAEGEYLAFMHCELAVTDSEWLDNLLNHGLRPEVAIVGGKQLSSDNKIRHAGFVLGMNGAAGEVFRGLEDNQPSYLGRLSLDQNYSAVSGDFMLVRKSVFDALNGFDADQPMYGDVDFCLRARNEGYMTVWTPYARIHRPAARQNPFPGETVHSSSKLKQLEEDKLYQRWMPMIANDPAFNANLSLKSRHFDMSSESEITWRPAQRENLPVFLAHNADISGCGYYRIMKPLEAMLNEGLAEGKQGMTLLTLSEMGKFKPDSLIIQRRYSVAFHNWIERTGKLHDVFKVFELDDYILNVPMKHYRRTSFKQETTGLMRKSLSYFDRFVVSTEPLAEAMRDMHPNIVVVKNRLPVDIWGQLQSLRNQGRKPRVGWAGGSSHRGDLEMIADVVKEFTNEVEWVFMGMCPEKLRPYVHEVHYGVDISLYPETLAALNLDLALAPVEDNIFNSCKSNLRLLEYGACGIPVICSDVACYRGDDLPVTRISNRFIDWRDAIRMHLADPEASSRMGQALQIAIRRDWMLTGNNVREWVKAWSAD
ncbi:MULTISPECIES: glycosyltransferase [Pantoea]|uniref:O-antigen biosynthesis protein n=2 Tax=Pantoea TaxID=53335 RepID=A0A0U3KTX8_9GAMM|nr:MULTISPECIES: glycosyltransferase [Pantoea]ALV91915.1 O-antigen biosynthesis protein [Pantoea vagans]KHJ67618.1 O-antigen biosynthesis protein [Pantoea rodasii]